MWKTICIVLIIYTVTLLSDAIYISERNETNLILLINSQQSELRTEQERQAKLLNELAKKSDIQDLHEKLDALLKAMDIQFIKAELSRQKLLTDQFIKESNVQSLKSDIQFIRAEQERQGKLIDNLFKYSLPICTTTKTSGIYSMILPKFSQPFKVVCDAETQGGGWTVILKRMDGSVDFYQNWTQYQNGFGDLSGEFFMGLDKIHALTAERVHELLVILEDFEGIKAFERYEEFAIGNEDQQYILHTLGKVNGTAGDSLSYHYKMKFSTFDRDNDVYWANCAVKYHGAWWYDNCHKSQLTGKYKDDTNSKGVNWYSFRGWSYSLKRAIMMIRPRR